MFYIILNFQAVKEHKESKAQWEKDKAELQKQIADLKDKLLEANVSGKDQVSEMKKDMDELLQVIPLLFYYLLLLWREPLPFYYIPHQNGLINKMLMEMELKFSYILRKRLTLC